MLRKTVVGVISAVTSCAVISLFGAGMANASAISHDVMTSTHNPAIAGYGHRVQQLHDQLSDAVKAENVSRVDSTVGKLSTVLGKLRSSSPQELGAQASGNLDKAAQQNSELANKLNELQKDVSTHALPVPGGNPLSSLSALLQSLLGTLQDVVAGLLGGGIPTPPAPIPTPPAPVPSPPVPVSGS